MDSSFEYRIYDVIIVYITHLHITHSSPKLGPYAYLTSFLSPTN